MDALPRRKRRGCLLVTLFRLTLFLCVILAAYSFVEPYLLRTEKKTLSYSSLPPAFDGLRVAFLSDIHWGPFYNTDRVRALFEKVQGLTPDLILLGGDYATDSATAIAFFEQMPPLSAPLGVYAIMGNHDRVMPESNFPRLRQAMLNAGVTPVVNAIYPIRRGDSVIYLAGIDDIWTGHPDISGVASALSQDDFVLLLAHSPDAIHEIRGAADMYGRSPWADLVLSGHTHGGQVHLLGWTPLLRRVIASGERYRTGWVSEGGTDLLISNGVGTTDLPIRLDAPPQIHLITLKSEPR